MELPDAIYNQVTALSERGNVALENGKVATAIIEWRRALELLPAPETQWDAAAWLHGSIGDAHWQAGRAAQTRDEMLAALNCSSGRENPFIYYRLGLAYRKLGDEANATENLLKAYMLAGDEIFEAEPEGREALTFLRSRVRLDAN